MLIVLIPIACVALLVIALMMCRLAAHSDRSHALAWSEWLAATALPEADGDASRNPGEALPADHPFRTYRATG